MANSMIIMKCNSEGLKRRKPKYYFLKFRPFILLNSYSARIVGKNKGSLDIVSKKYGIGIFTFQTIAREDVTDFAQNITKIHLKFAEI